MARRKWIVAAVVVGFSAVVGVTFALSAAVERVRESAARVHCNLAQVGLAFHNYADSHEGNLPPAAVCAPDGRPLLSWRVLILPYIEEEPRFKQFKMDEPWDSEHNLKLLDGMPKTYAAPWKKIVDIPPNHTVLHVFVGKGAAFEWNRGLNLKTDFPDGSSETLLYVEGGSPVPWTKPEEIPFEPDQPINCRGLFKSGARSGTVDGHGYRIIPNDCDQEILRAAITRDGGEKLKLPWDP